MFDYFGAQKLFNNLWEFFSTRSPTTMNKNYRKITRLQHCSGEFNENPLVNRTLCKKLQIETKTLRDRMSQ